MAEAPGSTGAFIGGTYPSGSYGYDISKFQCSSLPGGDHQISIVQVDGSSSANLNTCLPTELAWAGGGLNLYTYLTYGTSATNEPGCNGDTSCNAGYQAGVHAYTDAFNAGAGSDRDTVVARRREQLGLGRGMVGKYDGECPLRPGSAQRPPRDRGDR